MECGPWSKQTKESAQLEGRRARGHDASVPSERAIALAVVRELQRETRLPHRREHDLPRAGSPEGSRRAHAKRSNAQATSSSQDLHASFRCVHLLSSRLKRVTKHCFKIVHQRCLTVGLQRVGRELQGGGV